MYSINHLERSERVLVAMDEGYESFTISKYACAVGKFAFDLDVHIRECDFPDCDEAMFVILRVEIGGDPIAMERRLLAQLVTAVESAVRRIEQNAWAQRVRH